jgi:hypothetical protein
MNSGDRPVRRAASGTAISSMALLLAETLPLSTPIIDPYPAFFVLGLSPGRRGVAR